MAPLPPESTARFYLDYSDGINQHTLVARAGATAGSIEANFYFDALLAALDTILYTITIVGLRVSSDNSNVTNPMVWTGPASYGSGTMTGENAPRELRFLGRSADGRRVSASVYGYQGTTPAIYRLLASGVTPIADAITALEDAGTGATFLTISTQVPVWKPYASFNFNSYWEAEQRP